MALEVTDLSTLDQAAVATVQDTLAQLLGERFPDVDLTRGVVHDIVLHLSAALATGERENVDRLRRSQSLLAIEQDPTLADDDVVDRVLSNFRVTRDPGAAATGQVTVVVDAPVPLTIPNGASFESGGAVFATDQAYAVRTSQAAVIGPTDRYLRPIGVDRYAFTVPVACTEPGVLGMARRGVAMTPTFTIVHLVTAYAEGDFAGGLTPETNDDLLARLQAGIAARCYSNRANVDALVRAQPEFERVLALSIVGAGDPELVRAAHSLLPILLPGRTDVYARTAALPVSVALTKMATLIDVAGGGGVWQFTVDRDEAPGFYMVERVALPDQPQDEAGFAVVADARGLDLGDDEWAPDLLTAVEAAYSPYQTAAIRFVDDRTPTAGLVVGTAQAEYAVAVATMPQLADLQAFLGGRPIRPDGADVLVKAPIPCFLSLSFEVRKRASDPDPDVVAMQTGLADLVNGLGFPGTLHASLLAEEAHRHLADGVALGAIDMFGRVRRPDGTIAYIRDVLSTALQLPDEPAAMTTGRTVAFILDPADVAIAIRVVVVPEI